MPDIERGKNSNIDMILGDYRKGLLRLAWPTMLSMGLTMIYNLADSIWVAGLGPDPLAAIGFITPLFMILVGLGSGIGTGANSTISRFIGANEYDNAGNSAMHAIILSVIVSVLGAVIMYFALPTLLTLMGASGLNLEYGIQYGNIIFTTMFVLIYGSVASGILRGEGDVRRAMYAMGITSVVNIVLDPIFIYVLGYGIIGAAWATVISATISCVVMLYWTVFNNDTFIEINFRKFKYDRPILFNILNVSLPASTEMIILAFLGIAINYILALTNGADAVAVYTVNLRLLQLGMVPLVGTGQALLTLTGASFGMKDFKRLEDTYHYAIRLAVFLGIIIAAFFFIAAPYLCELFAYSESATLLPQMVSALHILCLWLIGTALGSLGSMLFQGMGKGFTALGLTFIRNFLLQVLFSILFGIVLGLSSNGVYLGVMTGCVCGGIISYLYANRYVKKQRAQYEETGTIG